MRGTQMCKSRGSAWGEKTLRKVFGAEKILSHLCGFQDTSTKSPDIFCRNVYLVSDL